MGTALLIITMCLAIGWPALSLVIGYEEVVTTGKHDANGGQRGWELHRPRLHLPHWHLPHSL